MKRDTPVLFSFVRLADEARTVGEKAGGMACRVGPQREAPGPAERQA